MAVVTDQYQGDVPASLVQLLSGYQAMLAKAMAGNPESYCYACHIGVQKRPDGHRRPE